MKKILAIALAVFSSQIYLTVAALAQQQPAPPVTTSQIIQPVFGENPLPVTSAAVQINGNAGPQTIYYWIVANYNVGATTPAGPFITTAAPNVLDTNNFVTVIPQYPAGVISVDLLKTSSNVQPSGVCNCAVATAVTSGPIQDQSNSTSSYTVSPVDVSMLTTTLQNEVQSAGVSNVVLRQKGQFVSNLSKVGPGGGQVTSVFGRVGAVVANTGDYDYTQVTNAIGGTGSANCMPVFVSAQTLGCSSLTDDGTNPTQIPNGAIVGPNGIVINDPAHAGAQFFGQGPLPNFGQANAFYWFADTGIPTTLSLAVPSAIGSVNQVLALTSVAGQVGKLGFITPGAASCPTCVVTNPSADQIISGAHVLGLSDTGSSFELGNAFIAASLNAINLALPASNGTLALLTDIPNSNPVPGTSGILSGGGVAWTGGLNFLVSPATYTIAGTQYSSLLTPLTLSAADPSNPRIDVIAVDNTGSAVVITGTPAATPAAPNVDPNSQIELTFALVAAGATTPSNITNENIYLENTEWTCGPTANFNCASTNNPYQGTVDIEATSAVSGNNVVLTRPSSTVKLSSFNNLVLYVRSKAAWPNPKSLSISWLNGTTVVGTSVGLKTGVFGFSSTNTSSYQQIVIPVSSFNAGTNNVSKLKIQVAGGGGSIGFYLDNIFLQGGVTPPPVAQPTMLFRGAYSSSASYNPNDVVTSGGVTYVALLPSTNSTPTNANTNWQQVVTTPLSIANGGTGTASTLTGLVRGNASAMTAAELSGDITTSGSNATTIANLAVTNAKIANSTIDLTAKVTGILPGANGGTGNGFFAVSGPASSLKTFTFPNSSQTMTFTVASGAKALATGAISSAACTSAQTDTATGTLTTDTVQPSFNADPTGVTGFVPLTTGMLTIIAYPTADTVNFKVCNNTSASITPGAITLNWRVVR